MPLIQPIIEFYREMRFISEMDFTAIVVFLLLAVVIDWGLSHLKPQRAPNIIPVIDSPIRSYRLESKLPGADLCRVFLAADESKQYVLKTPQKIDPDRLLQKEHRVLCELIDRSGVGPYGKYLPQPVELFRANGRPCSVFEYRDGFTTAERIRERYPHGLDGRHLGWMFNRTLEILGYVHNKGWIHGAVLPPHLLFHAENHGLQLVGWTHAAKIGRRIEFAPGRFKNWYPGECHRRQPATPSVDIFLAAKSMIYLAGGDPVANLFPDHIAGEIRRFLQSCLLDSPRMRPQDAWQLHEDFSSLLESLYGPPQFHELAISD